MENKLEKLEKREKRVEKEVAYSYLSLLGENSGVHSSGNHVDGVLKEKYLLNPHYIGGGGSTLCLFPLPNSQD